MMGMETVYYQRQLAVAVIVILVFHHCLSEDGCTNAGLDKETSGSCTFWDGLCGWQTTSGFTHYRGKNGYVKFTNPQSASRLMSPWFCATGNLQCSISFWFYYGRPERCQLSVHVLTEHNSSLILWTGHTHTGNEWLQLPRPLNINCTDCMTSRYQIIFEGKKLRKRPCGDTYDEIDIDDIEYRCSPSPSTTMSPGTIPLTAKVHHPFKSLADAEKKKPMSTKPNDFSAIPSEASTNQDEQQSTCASVELLSTILVNISSVNKSDIGNQLTTEYLPHTEEKDFTMSSANESFGVKTKIAKGDKPRTSDPLLSGAGLLAILVSVIVAINILLSAVIVLCRRKGKRSALSSKKNTQPDVIKGQSNILPSAPQSSVTILKMLYSNCEDLTADELNHNVYANYTGDQTEPNVTSL